LAQAFKDPAFSQLLGEYAKSIADPEVKQEADAYLRQLERDGALEEVLGRDTVVVAPAPAFVIKTLDKAKGGKLFVNICTSDKVRPSGHVQLRRTASCILVLHPSTT
jgi:hypothetical protein